MLHITNQRDIKRKYGKKKVLTETIENIEKHYQYHGSPTNKLTSNPPSKLKRSLGKIFLTRQHVCDDRDCVGYCGQDDEGACQIDECRATAKWDCAETSCENYYTQYVSFDIRYRRRGHTA